MDNKDPKDSIEVLFTAEQIAERVQELAIEIVNDPEINIDNVTMIGIMNGAMFFLADLSRAIDNPKIVIDSMSISSYSEGEESNRQPHILSDLKYSIKGRDAIIVEDIVDTGYSMETLLRIIQAKNPRILKVCALLSKDSRREVEVPIDYLGFFIDDKWVEGYGLDSNGRGRGRKNIIARVS